MRLVRTRLLAALGIVTLSMNVASAEPYRSTIFTEPCFTGGIEGPAVGPNGTLYVVNFERSGTIGAVHDDGTCRLFLELPTASIGNGIRFDSQGNMVIADYKGHNLLKYDFRTKLLTVLGHDERLNQPNDIAITSDDFVYASDPNWKDSTGQLWSFDPRGQARLLESGMGTTNGIDVSPDDRYLYVGESVQRRIWRYEIQKNHGLANKVLFFEFPDHGLDGMRTDKLGNLYVARFGKGTVDVLSPNGKLLHEVKLHGLNPTNLAFGGRDGKTVYVTIQDKRHVERFESEHRGREHGTAPKN